MNIFKKDKMWLFSLDDSDLFINFGNLKNNKSILSDKITFSTYVAEKFLQKISTDMELIDEDRVKFQIVVEGFLYFMIGARDALLQNINKELKLGLKVKKVNLQNILLRLQKMPTNNSNLWHVFDLLNNCLQEYNTSDYNREKSWLWELNTLRNRIAHTNIISKNIDVTLDTHGGVTVCNMIIVNGIKESNPRKYFQKAYDNFIQLQLQIVPCLTLKKT